jgi:hypothetical protein
LCTGLGQALSLALLISLFGCLPKEAAMPTSSSPADALAPSYNGFTGAGSAQTVGATKVTISWTPSTDSAVVAYNVYDSTFLFAPKLIKTVQAPANQLTLTSLANQSYYTFRVRAANAKNVEDGNLIDVGAIPYAGVLPAQVLSSTAATIPFNDGSNADEVDVFCKTTSSPAYALKKKVNTVTQTQTTLSDLIPGEEYTCRAALVINGFTDNNTITTVFTPIGTASTLTFSTQPGSALVGANLSPQPVITIKDANGNVVSAGPDSTAVISLTVAATSPSIGTIRGTTSVAAIKGVATFTGLNLQEIGDKVITATKSDTSTQVNGSGTLTNNSNQFTISPGAVSPVTSTIAISPSVPPNSALVANGTSSYTVTITLKDQYGNPVIGTKPTFASSVSGDTLSQPTAVTDAAGQSSGSISSTTADEIAPFRTLSIASPSGLTAVSTNAPFVPGVPTKLAFVQQPVNSPSGLLGVSQVQIAVQDAQGNIINTGTGSNASITLSIASNVNGAVLSGTLSAAAVNGVATFSDLGIDKTQTGYRLLASAGTYTPAYSNSFNVQSGTPKKIKITGPATVLSGTCSTAYTFQLQDQGGNATNALQNTPVTISGLSGASLYSSNACGGTALSATMTFTAGSSTKTVYLKNIKAEAITIAATDTSSVLTAGSLPVNVSPSKISLFAQAPAPAAPGTPLAVVAAKCSAAIIITPMGEDGNPGPLFTSTSISITGIVGSSAGLYSDNTCTTLLDATSIPLAATAGSGTYPIKVYLKDQKAETLNLSISDPVAVLVTASGLQTVNVTASNIIFAGPLTVVSGTCSSAYTVTLKDALGNAVPAPANYTLSVNGLAGNTTALFHFVSNCADAGSSTTMVIPSGSSTAQIFLNDSTAETLSVKITDPALNLADSAAIAIGISPSALSIVGPSPASAKTTVCAGPFTVNTLDGASNVAAAITPITVTLTGADAGGAFFNSSTCATTISQLNFSAGTSSKTFYYKGQYPNAALTLTASDAASVLTAGTVNFVITAAKGWLGTSGTMTDAGGNLLGFQIGKAPVAARVDGPSSARKLRFDSTKQYLYVTDGQYHRILKYDYTNMKYVGWIGQYDGIAGIGISGSNISTPSAAQCVSTTWGSALPGWCVGGLSAGNGNNSRGGMNWPDSVAEDGTYIYVTQRNGFAINRYNATTGAFAGWIGEVWTTPTAAATGGPAGCTSVTSGNITPGWCIGGQNNAWCTSTAYCNGSANPGTPGLPWFPTGVAVSGGNLYVAGQGAILRYNATTGALTGWIGVVGTTSPTGGAANCTTSGTNALTPGWCTGGKYQMVNPKTFGTGGGINAPNDVYIIGNILYVVHTDSGGVINTYNLTTGAFGGPLPNLNYAWPSPFQMTSDGTYFYFADATRITQVDSTGVVQGWIGKVNNNNSMSGAAGCSTLVPNADTPGWCLGGSSKHGVSETSVNQATGIAYDGNGHILTGQGDANPSIKRWDIATGAYSGTLAFQSTSSSQWSNDASSFAQMYAMDDNSMYQPAGMYSDGTNIYMLEWGAARLKKISIALGTVVGWIGGITSPPTGGAAGCLGVNAFSGSPGWCLGSLPNPSYLWNYMIDYRSDGIMQKPLGVTGDGTYLYTVDAQAHRIQKWNKSTGAYVGWLGAINISPTGPASTTCVGATIHTFTPGWCTGGISESGTGDGMLSQPTGIVEAGGNLYVIDNANHRVSSYNASTGAFNGWIGRINGTVTNCTPLANGSGYNVASAGWCKGGTGSASVVGDKGGGFYFWGDQNGREMPTTDGTYLYIPNTNNARVDKIKLDGTYMGSTSSNYGNYSYTWTTNTTTLAAWGSSNCLRPQSLWTSSTSAYIYGTGYHGCYGNVPVVWKMDKATGTMIGYQGAIDPGGSVPNGGDAGCAGATQVTPGWCQGGNLTGTGFRLGQFSDRGGITVDANFVYVSDQGNHRLTRIPK